MGYWVIGLLLYPGVFQGFVDNPLDIQIKGVKAGWFFFIFHRKYSDF